MQNGTFRRRALRKAARDENKLRKETNQPPVPVDHDTDDDADDDEDEE